MSRGRAWPAPAKINRFLHVTGRRADGFHTLETLFQFITLADELRFGITHDGRVERRGGSPEIAPETDLAVRAARLLRQRTGCRRGAHIEVTKRIPAGGGLGGGSSDAATALVALNRLWGIHLETDDLAVLALELGADVPVFVRGTTAWAEGVGERLTPAEPDTPWLALVNPGVAVATAAVFNDPELTRNTPRTTIRGLDAGATGNDCEAVVRKRYPEVARALDWLTQFAPARMTGTGGCVFAAMPSAAAARAVVRRLPECWRGWAVRGLNRSPLLECLADSDHWGVAKR